HKEMEVKIPLPQVFKHPTVRGMAEYIAGAAKEAVLEIERVAEKDYYPLSSAQTRIYLLYRMNPESLNYNMAQVIPLESRMEKTKMQKIMRALIARHESLRTSFIMKNGTPVQKIHDPGELAWEVDDMGKVEGADIETELRERLSPFDLTEPPLIRVVIAETAEGDGMLLWDMHHIVSDGISIEILEKEFHALARGEE
ncbi:MAG: hypothetical protein GY757_46880, partial [bacterium]|nr:hypothetical protein [bacterium]